MKKAFLLLTGIFGFTFAQENPENLRLQLQEQRKLIQELEKKIEALERAQQAKPEEKKEQTKPEPADRSLQLRAKFDERLRAYQVSPFRQTAFLPDISFIMDFSAVARNRGDKEYKELLIPRLWHRHEHDGHGHGHGMPNENLGFNLNYGELYLFAPVDPYFDLQATIPFSEGGAQIEEAYAVTRGLPFNLQLKIGKFRSSFGRLNSQHPHAWDFANVPLPYLAFLGDHGLTEKGLGINWLAPTPVYLLFGVEVLQGENDQSFGYRGFTITDPNTNNTFTLGDKTVPNLYLGYVKTSFDIGKTSILTGLSYAQGRHRHPHDDHGLDAKTKLYGFDLTARHQIDSVRYLAFQGEYIYRDQDGTRYGFSSGNVATLPVERKQSGLYTQLVGRFHKQWRAGVRYELINKNDVKVGTTKPPTPDNLPAYYAMLEYTPTEFSRIRLQAGENRALYEEVTPRVFHRKPVKEIILQFTFAIGAHGAHPF